MDKDFLHIYLKGFSELIIPQENVIADLIHTKNALMPLSETNKKCIIIGNGGSAAIASHFSVDLTKNTGIRCVNFNESSLLTCFSNDYGYSLWAEKAIEFYGEEGDVLIAISSSGNSENILNGCKSARLQNFSKIITLSGFRFDNPLRQLGNINLWVNSKSYNYIENLHQIWLLSIVDLLIEMKKN